MRLRELPAADAALVVPAHDGRPPPPGGGQLVVLPRLQPTLQFLAQNCHWSNDELSALRLVLLLRAEEVEVLLQAHAQRRRALHALLTQGPRAMPRPVFHADPDFVDSDIAARAIVDLLYCFDLSSGLRVLSTVIRYRKHPLAHDLTLHLGEALAGGAPLRLSFPRDGEVMYVITTAGHIILAARSGHQKDLPHPTLVGGDDPEVLSGGIVHFQDHRIIRVHINASGHFKPNHVSSVEVSLLCFGRLPPEAFHRDFEGYEVFRHGGALRIAGPVPTGGSALTPFRVCDGPDIRGTLEATAALQRRGQMHDALGMMNKLTAKVVGGILFDGLVNLQPNWVLYGLMTPHMRGSYRALMQLMHGIAGLPARKGTLGPNAAYRALLTALLQRLAEIAKGAR